MAVVRGCTLGAQGGMLLLGSAEPVPGAGGGRGKAWEQQLDAGVKINFSMRPGARMTPVSVWVLSKCT